MKENECKEKKIYFWCASKEKNIDATWKVTGELKHNSVHYYNRLHHLVNNTRHDPGVKEESRVRELNFWNFQIKKKIK